MKPESHYFVKLIRELKRDQKIGITSGGVYYKEGSRLVYEKRPKNRPCGGARLYRKNVLDSIGGFPITYSWDSVTCSQAILKGWKTRLFANIKTIQARKTFTSDGIWKGYVLKGKTDHYLSLNFLLIVAKFIKYSLHYPFFHSIGYLYGYFKSFILFKKRIDNEEVRNYNSKRRILEKIGLG
jgi:hypothetical protein